MGWTLAVQATWARPTLFLLGLVCGGDAEGYSSIVIRFRGCRQIQIGERDFLRVLGSKIPERLADDGVVLNLLPMLIAEDQQGRREDRTSLLFIVCRGTRGRWRVGVLIAIGLFLAKHSLLFEALLVHLVGEGEIVVVVVVVAGIRIPVPQPRIVSPPRNTYPASEAVVAKRAIAETATELVVQKGVARKAALREGWTVREGVRRAAREVAADVTAAEAVSRETTGMTTTKTSVTAATLRPQGYGQEESERRYEHQATHTASL
jgi:hypothetical protein